MKNNDLHVAVIMDGNGRWATERGLSRPSGHRAGIQSVRDLVKVAPRFDITTLTLYAFSSDNWKRPVGEVRALMRLFQAQLNAEVRRMRDNGVRLQIIGRRDRLPLTLRDAITEAEAATSGGTTLELRIAIDYSGRESILRAAYLLFVGGEEEVDQESFKEALHLACHAHGKSRDVDLLIRTGGEQRLSDFLLWECAYAELYFTECKWPDFGVEELQVALSAFRQRERRYGGVPVAA